MSAPSAPVGAQAPPAAPVLVLLGAWYVLALSGCVELANVEAEASFGVFTCANAFLAPLLPAVPATALLLAAGIPWARRPEGGGRTGRVLAAALVATTAALAALAAAVSLGFLLPALVSAALLAAALARRALGPGGATAAVVIAVLAGTALFVTSRRIPPPVVFARRAEEVRACLQEALEERRRDTGSYPVATDTGGLAALLDVSADPRCRPLRWERIAARYEGAAGCYELTLAPGRRARAHAARRGACWRRAACGPAGCVPPPLAPTPRARRASAR